MGIRRFLGVSALVLPLSGGAAQAQLNESDSLRFQVRFTSAGSLLEGNVARLLLLNKLELARANETWGFSSRNDYQYGTTFHRRTENDVLSFNYLYYRPLARVYPYLMVLAETNWRRRIDFRYQVGPGLTWNVLARKEHILKLSATVSYERTLYRDTTYEDERYNGSRTIETMRLTGRLYGRHKLADDKLRVHYEFWFQQSLAYRPNYRYFSEASLELPLSKKVAFRLGARYTYEHIELLGLKPYDLYATYGITLTNF